MIENLRNYLDAAITPLGAFLPNILGALAILILGWIAALIISRVLQSGLVRLGVGGYINKGLTETQRYAPGKVERVLAKAVFAILMLFVLVGFFQALGMTEITRPLTGFLNQLFEFAPRLIGPALLIFVAWIVANLLRALTRRALTSFKLDSRLESEAGLEGAQERPVSVTISESVYWLTYLIFLPAILSALELTGLLGPVRAAVTEMVGFVPNLFAAAVILVVGWIVARVLRRLTANFLVSVGVEAWSKEAGLDAAVGKQSISGAIGMIVYVIVFIPVLVAAMIVPRVLLRMVTTAPAPLEGPALEHFAANVSHTALYGFMLAMPATGIAMGYYGGKGVPFYGLYTFPGKGSPGMPAKEKEDGKFAGTMFKWHTWMGQYIFYLLPVHVGAVGLHTFKGQPILSRVNPFASPK